LSARSLPRIFNITDYQQLQAGGFHSGGYISDLFAKAFVAEGRKAWGLSNGRSASLAWTYEEVSWKVQPVHKN
jgi:hypothetical protein